MARVARCPTYGECWRYAADGYTNPISKSTATACEENYPDDFVADTVGKRQRNKLWHVDFTWSRWWKNLWE